MTIEKFVMAGQAAQAAVDKVIQSHNETSALGKWLVWSNEHLRWWKPNRLGYCERRADAGLYSFDEACLIVRDANIGLHGEPHETMVRADPQRGYEATDEEANRS